LARHFVGSLERMIAGGLIAESDERPVDELDDARRRYYKLTKLGSKVLAGPPPRILDPAALVTPDPISYR
jgi:hypothetical protein